MLTPIGLSLNFIGSIVLLGSDLKIVADGIRRVDPVHYAYSRGMRSIQLQSIEERNKNDNSAYPFDSILSADQWRLWPILWFLNHHAEQDIPRNAAIDIRGGWFKVNGEQLRFPEEAQEPDRMASRERVIDMEKGGTFRTETLTINSIPALIYEARINRIYIYGAGLLALGFLVRLVALSF